MDDANLSELSEQLWSNAKRSALVQLLCRDLTKACKGKVPPLPKVIWLSLWRWADLDARSSSYRMLSARLPKVKSPALCARQDWNG